MSQFHNIFCRSGDVLTRAEIAGHAKDGFYGNGEPTFVPPPDADPRWQRLELYLPGVLRPIVFLRDTDPADIGEFVAEALSDPPVRLRPETVDHLEATVQVIGVELSPASLDDDAWEMLDDVQSFIARQLRGLLIAPDGVYDAQLQPLD